MRFFKNIHSALFRIHHKIGKDDIDRLALDELFSHNMNRGSATVGRKKAPSRILVLKRPLESNPVLLLVINDEDTGLILAHAVAFRLSRTLAADCLAVAGSPPWEAFCSARGRRISKRAPSAGEPISP